MNSLTGGCLCGAVRFRSSSGPRHSSLCHCTSCRRASGAHSLGWAAVTVGDFEFTAGTPVEYRSSPPVTRTFCGACGSPLTYRHGDWPDIVDVAIGSLDSPGDVPPVDHIWMSDAVAWDRPADGLTQYQKDRLVSAAQDAQ
jgi:hypothetical protein